MNVQDVFWGAVAVFLVLVLAFLADDHFDSDEPFRPASSAIVPSASVRLRPSVSAVETNPTDIAHEPVTPTRTVPPAVSPQPATGHAPIPTETPEAVVSAPPPATTQPTAIAVVTAPAVAAAGDFDGGDLLVILLQHAPSLSLYRVDILALAECESRVQLDAIGAAGELGLFQFIPGHFSRFGYDLDDWQDPVVQVKLLVDLQAADGWGPWACAVGTRLLP